MTNDLQRQMAFEGKRKSMGIAYLLWFFLGFFGVHRFYAGKTKTGIAQLLLTLTGVGILVNLFWLLADIILIPGMIRERNLETMLMLNHGSAPDQQPQALAGQPRILTKEEKKRQAMLEDLKTMGYRKERRDTSHLYR